MVHDVCWIYVLRDPGPFIALEINVDALSSLGVFLRYFGADTEDRMGHG